MRRTLDINIPTGGFANAPDSNAEVQKSYAAWVARILCLNEVAVYEWATKHRVNLAELIKRNGPTLASGKPDVMTRILNDKPLKGFELGRRR